MKRLLRLLAGFFVGLITGFVATLALISERGRGLLPSTRRFLAQAHQRHLSPLERLHGYAYAAFPYHYIGWAINGIRGPLGRPLLWLINLLPFVSGEDTGTIADTYHGKVVPLEEATRLVTINQEVSLQVPEQVIPFQRARDLIIQDPHHIVALDCPCRLSHKNPCLPLDVCIIVGEPFASFILEHHPHRARRITPEEAVRTLREEDARGHVHHAFFKEAMLDRFYAICNCCQCCCGAMAAHRNDTPMLIPSGYLAQVEMGACVGCGQCAAYCQFGALALEDGHIMVDEARCMGCGICLDKCQQEAMSLRLEPAKGEPLEIQKLMADAAQLTWPFSVRMG